MGATRPVTPGGAPAVVGRRRFLAGAGAAFLTGGIAVEGLFLEPGRLAVTTHTVGDSTGGGRAIRLAILTDLHLKELDDFHERLVEAVRSAEPDAVVLIGDSVDSAAGLPLLRDFLRMLPDAPTRIATLGNWEYWSGIALGAIRGVYSNGDTRLLVNEAHVMMDGAAIFGLDDSLAGTPDLGPLSADPARDVILLSHCPAYRDELVAAVTPTISAMFSGHTHGGQVALGKWAPFRPPGSGAYVSGWYRAASDRPDLYVSRGLGTSVIPFRLGSVPELTLVDWFPRRG